MEIACIFVKGGKQVRDKQPAATPLQCATYSYRYKTGYKSGEHLSDNIFKNMLPAK